jgi:signal transduction histidine kinase
MAENGTKNEALTGQAEAKDIGSMFLANFVHQIVNPLAGVIGTLDNITDKTYEGQVATQKINAARAQLQQCVSLIRNLAYLSDFFSQTGEREALRPAREDSTCVLPQVVIEAAQFFQIAADKKGIHIELDDPKSQYRVSVRPELLKQVFINIFDNWLKYGLKDEAVHIQPRVNSKKELVISIAGKTIPFDNNEAERLFELGYRSPQARDRVAQGTGIGLYICREIVVRGLQGSMSAEHSAKTKESTFRIAIPSSKWAL